MPRGPQARGSVLPARWLSRSASVSSVWRAASGTAHRGVGARFPRAQAPGFHDLLIGSVASTGTPPHVIQYAPEMLTIIGLVAAGIGVSLVPASVARLALEGVTYRPVNGAPVAELTAITRAGDDSPLVRAFVENAAG